MSYTVEQLQTLENAIAQGSLEVWYGDKRVKYRSLAEMLQTAALIKKELGLTTPGSKRLFANFNKGL